MILNRLGNKRKMVKKLLPYFPEHDMFIEPFFAAGGMFFYKPKAKYNLLNDLDGDVYNLFQVVSNEVDALAKYLYEMPVHEDLWRHWRANQETEPVRKAARFLLLSNFGYMGKPETLRLGIYNTKKILLERLTETNRLIFDCIFANKDFEAFINSISFSHERDFKRAFIYADPPYIGTSNNYANSFTKEDFVRLLHTLLDSNVKFAVSEFDNPFILECVEQIGEGKLHVIVIGERHNMKNRRTEILITNYALPTSHSQLTIP